jgi:division protein CdvB (Snf7/Vps24/ESCRT-III family)
VVDVKSDIHPTKLRCKLQAASCKLQAASCKLQAASCKLQAASCKLQAASCKLQANQRGCSTPLLLGFFLPLVACGL